MALALNSFRSSLPTGSSTDANAATEKDGG
jgi:hypothetical protein